MNKQSLKRDHILPITAKEWLINIQASDSERLFCMVDKRVEELYSIKSWVDIPTLCLHANEKLKNLSTATKMWEFLSANRADRESHIIAIGGGIITDMAGFVASTFMRGVRVTYIPTTLLGMIDAAIGGKNGINLSHWKNRIGSFYFPEQTILDLRFLKTLPHSEWQNAWAEILKHALISGGDVLHQVFSARTVEDCQALCSFSFLKEVMQVKMDCVESDLFDKGIRKKLNAGHTAGHAIESLFLKDFRIIHHGQAVAAGLWIETEIAFFSDLILEDKKRILQQYIAEFFDLPVISKMDIDSIFGFMKGDKKNLNRQINFSLVYDWGGVGINHQVSNTMIKDALRSYCNAMENS